jgi:hypothetical protein
MSTVPALTALPALFLAAPPAFLRADDFYEKCGKWIAGFHRVR